MSRELAADCVRRARGRRQVVLLLVSSELHADAVGESQELVELVLKKQTDIGLFLVYRNPPNGSFARHALFETIETQAISDLETLRKGGFDLVFSPLIKDENVLNTFLPIYLDFPERSKILFDPFGYGDLLIARIEKMRVRQNIKLEYVKGMRVWNCRGNLKPGEPYVAEF